MPKIPLSLKPLKILVLCDINNGGEWIATLRLIKEIRNTIYPPTFFLIAFQHAQTENRFPCFEKVVLIPYAKYNPPVSFFKKLISNFSRIRSALNLPFIKKNHFDVILTTNYLFVLPILFNNHLKKIPLVYFFHGIRSLPSLNWKNINYREILIKILERISLLLSSVIIVPSDSGKKYISTMLGPAAKYKNIRIIPNFVPVHFMEKLSPSVLRKYKQKLNIPLNYKIILYSSRLAQFKGLENLLSAFQLFSRFSPKTILILAYPNQKQDELYVKSIINTIRIMKLEDKISLIADSSIKQLKALNQMADLSILPSELEINPLVMLESLACGTPFIGTDTGNIKEVLSNISEVLILINNKPETIYKKIKEFFSLTKKGVENIKRESVATARSFNSHIAVSKFCSLLSELTK